MKRVYLFMLRRGRGVEHISQVIEGIARTLMWRKPILEPSLPPFYDDEGSTPPRGSPSAGELTPRPFQLLELLLALNSKDGNKHIGKDI